MKIRIATALAALATAPLVGCGVLGGTTFQEFTVGECIELEIPEGDEATQVGELPVVDCAQEHGGEVFAVADSTATSFDLAALQDEVVNLCIDNFEPYVGVTYEVSQLDVSFLYPASAETWAAGDRGLVCVLTTLDGSKSTGSFAGSGF